MSEVLIYGAGMSGLIAACNLAREGYDVTVRDREESWGGSKVFNPSTHTTPLDLAATSRYIGIDIAPAFVPVKINNLYFGDFKFPIPTPGATTWSAATGPPRSTPFFTRSVSTPG